MIRTVTMETWARKTAYHSGPCVRASAPILVCQPGEDREDFPRVVAALGQEEAGQVFSS